MNLSSVFGFNRKHRQVEIGRDTLLPPVEIAQDSSIRTLPSDAPVSACLSLSRPISGETAFFQNKWFLPTQADWINDPWPLKIMEKARQVGITKTDAFDSVFKASPADAKFDVWVSSRDELQAKLYLEDCKDWAKILHLAVTDLGHLFLDSKNTFSAYVLQFANGR